MSRPTQFLQKKGLLKGRILDYGCGHGKDCDILGCEGYDPYYRPEKPEGHFDTIFCQYVLNVLPNLEDRQSVLDEIAVILKPEGKGYITVRSDKRNLNGFTSKGTWQGFIELDLPKMVGSGFHMYILEK